MSNDDTAGGVSSKLQFTKNLNDVINKVHAANNIDEIMLDVSKDICTAFNADRLTIYVVGEDKTSLISKVKTGLNSFKASHLPSPVGLISIGQMRPKMEAVRAQAEANARAKIEEEQRKSGDAKPIEPSPRTTSDKPSSPAVWPFPMKDAESSSTPSRLSGQATRCLSQVLHPAFASPTERPATG